MDFIDFMKGVGMNYVASLSCGKDSLAMVLGIMERNLPLTHCVMFDTGMEYQAIYRNLEKLKPLLDEYGCHLEVIRPENHYLEDMLLRVVNKGKANEHYGYLWCGNSCRWRTANKVQAINKYLNSLGEYVQYIGIAYDEPKRIKHENNKKYLLVDWKWTEKDCLEYCYSKGFDWKENGVELYEILDRVSCWCCGNKNLKELRNMYHYLPDYWDKLKALQSRIDLPFKGNKTIFDLEERFKQEDAQMSIFDILEV